MTTSATVKTETYLTFLLDGESFAVSVGGVSEVIELARITRVPRTPPFLRGVINLRGNVVPVVDMRVKFGMTPVPDTVSTCIVVMEVPFEGERTIIGALVDAVREVFDLPAEQIGPPPRFGARFPISFLSGMASRDGAFIMVLDVERVFSSDELEQAAEAAGGPSPDAVGGGESAR